MRSFWRVTISSPRLAVPVAIRTPSRVDPASCDELGTTAPRELIGGRVVARHEEERCVVLASVRPGPERVVDHLLAAPARDPVVADVGGEDRRFPLAQAERSRGLPRVVETPHGFQLVRAVIGDKRAEDPTGSDRTRSSHTFVSRNRACLQGEVGPRERT